MIYVEVTGNGTYDLEKALSKFLKKVQESGLLEECRRREYFETNQAKKHEKRRASRKII